MTVIYALYPVTARETERERERERERQREREREILRIPWVP